MGLLDQMQPTPRNRMLGLLADALTAANDYTQKPDKTMPGGLANPPLAALSGFLGLPAVATTAQRMSYGEPLTNLNKANVPLLKPETADALMTVAPLAVAAAPYVAKGAQAAMANLEAANTTGRLPMAGQRGAVVWHGSPHKFDRFDSSKIGTGEGAQAYGHGLYLADSKGTAEFYKNSLGKDAEFTGQPWAEPLKLKMTMPFAKRDKASMLIALEEDTRRQMSNLADKEFTRHASNKALSEYETMHENTKKALEYVKSLKDGIVPMPEGTWQKAAHLYKVDLPDEHIAKMLDWDKPLSQQASEVQAAVAKIKANLTGPFSRDMTGDQLLMHIQSTLKGAGRGDMKAESVLREQGIPGIRYLDGGSRSAGSGTSNYVVFPGNEGLLQILERNGAPVGK